MAGTRVQPSEGFAMYGPETRARPRTGSGLSRPGQDQTAAQAKRQLGHAVVHRPGTSALQYLILASLGHARLAKAKMVADRGERGVVPTIDRYISAVDPMGARRRQKSDDVGHLLGGPQTAHRKTVTDIVIKIFMVGEAVAIPAIARDQN